MKKIWFIFLIFFMICGCGNITYQDKEETGLEKMMNGNYIIVDVRTAEEFMDGHLVGAINIPYDEIDTVELDKTKNIFVYCKSGKRSGIAFHTLQELGYHVYDLGSYDDIDLEKE